MEQLKRKEAFSRAVSVFGEWRCWNRWQHIAYGLIRGVPYPAMEKWANDNPDLYQITRSLVQLGAWPTPDQGQMETPKSWWERLFGSKKSVVDKAVSVRLGYAEIQPHMVEVAGMVTWVRKPVREPRMRCNQRAEAAGAGE